MRELALRVAADRSSASRDRVESPRSVLGFLSRPVKRVARYEYCIRCNSKRVSSAELIERACSGPSRAIARITQPARRRCESVVVARKPGCRLAPDPRGLKRNESPYDVPSGVEEELPPVCSPPAIPTRAHARVLILPAGFRSFDAGRPQTR